MNAYQLCPGKIYKFVWFPSPVNENGCLRKLPYNSIPNSPQDYYFEHMDILPENSLLFFVGRWGDLCEKFGFEKRYTSRLVFLFGSEIISMQYWDDVRFVEIK